MKKKTIISILLALIVIVGTVLALWLYESNSFAKSDTMPSHITVNGVDCSNLTKKEAREKIIKEANAHNFSITGDNSTALPLKNTKYKLKSQFENVISEQGFLNYVKYLFGTPYEIKMPMKVSETTEAFEWALDCFIENEDKGKTKTEDAYVDLSTREFKVVPEVYGENIDRNKLRKTILSSIENCKYSLNYAHKDFVVQPSITSDSQQIQKEVDYCNTYLAKKITYKFGSKSKTIKPKELDQMFNARTGKVKVDKSAVGDFVLELAKKYDTYYSSRSFKSTSGRTVSLAYGTYGYIIDQQKEIDQLISDIKGTENVSREPIYKVKGNGRDGVNDILNTYVEIDLSAQHVYYYKNGEKIVSSPCVSGCPKPDKVGETHGTVCGVFTIAYLEKDATLKGGDEKLDTDYESDVKYWMPFFNGIGLHDAPWRKKFGGTIYKTGGSHGCINLPESAAKKLFENVSAGTIVVVFY